MKQLVHGGDWMGYRERFGRDALDFSANVSPLGLPEGVAQAIREALTEADRYPDPLCRTLRAALSEAEGLPAEQILCGNGAADLIFRLVWAAKPRRALVTAPTFAEYAAALDTAGCEVKRFFLREAEDFAVTDALVDAVDESTDMVFLCQPNNPTGQLAALPLVEQILRRCAACGTLLVVDDDTEVAHYLRTLLSAHYKVICRFNADDALKALHEESPDLVLSDVVMPGKDGYQFCREIKEDLQLCHLPVILVTAKATVENQVEGLDTGADAYVTKPFDPTYLLALVKSLLKNREKARTMLGKATQTDKIEENILSPQDNVFMTELYHLMESELSNPELDIARMTELLRISRTKFYYKVKGLTGESPSTFFKTYKLNRAAELITEGKHTVSEIADMTGFSTLSHFSKSFKKQFGVSPSEYGK